MCLYTRFLGGSDVQRCQKELLGKMRPRELMFWTSLAFGAFLGLVGDHLYWKEAKEAEKKKR